jgi:hypothetical protein
MPSKLFRRSARNYEVVAAVCGGKNLGISLAVIEDGVATYATGKVTWPQLRQHLKKIDVFRGTHELAIEKDYTEFYVNEAHNAGCITNLNKYYNKTLKLEFMQRSEKAEEELLEYLKKLPVKIAKHNRRFDIRFLERMLNRQGELLGEGNG